MSKLSLRDIREYQRRHPTVDPYSNLVSRRLSPPISWLSVRLGVHPNVLTMLGILAGITTGVLLPWFGNLAINIAIIVVSQLWHLFDVVDGEVARLTKKTSLQGQYLDLMGHYVVDAIVPLGLMAHFAQSSYAEYLPAIWIPVLHFVFPMLFVASRLSGHVAELTLRRGGFTEGVGRGSGSRGPQQVLRRWIAQIWNCLGVMLFIGAASAIDTVLRFRFGAQLPLLEGVFIFYAATLPLVFVIKIGRLWRVRLKVGSSGNAA